MIQVVLTLLLLVAIVASLGALIHSIANWASEILHSLIRIAEALEKRQ